MKKYVALVLRFQFLSLLLIGSIFPLLPAIALAGAYSGIDCGSGYTVAQTGLPRTCSQTLSGNQGTATFVGYGDGGFFSFGSSLHVTASNYVHNAGVVDDGQGGTEGRWWNVLAQAGWGEMLTFYGRPKGTIGTLELTYTVSGQSYVSSNFYNNGQSSFPIRGILSIEGDPSVPGSGRYKYMNMGNSSNPTFNESLTNTIQFNFETAKHFGAWIRSEFLLQGDASGLIPVMNGEAYADFAHTATVSQVRVFDADGIDITGQVQMITSTGETNPFRSPSVPEPCAMLLLGLGLAGLAGVRRRIQK